MLKVLHDLASLPPREHSLHPQRMPLIRSSFIHKILDPIPYQTCVISKFSVRFIFKKHLLLNSSESTFTWTARMSIPTAPFRTWWDFNSAMQRCHFPLCSTSKPSQGLEPNLVLLQRYFYCWWKPLARLLRPTVQPKAPSPWPAYHYWTG